MADCVYMTADNVSPNKHCRCYCSAFEALSLRLYLCFPSNPETVYTKCRIETRDISCRLVLNFTATVT